MADRRVRLDEGANAAALPMRMKTAVANFMTILNIWKNLLDNECMGKGACSFLRRRDDDVIFLPQKRKEHVTRLIRKV